MCRVVLFNAARFFFLITVLGAKKAKKCVNH